MIVQVTVGNNTSRKTITVSNDTKISDILNDNDIDYSNTRVTCNGETLKASDFGKTLAEVIGTNADTCYLLAVIKMDNGNN